MISRIKKISKYIRLVFYVFFIIVLNIFIFPLDNHYFAKPNESSKNYAKQNKTTTEAVVAPRAFVLSSVGLSVYNYENQKNWELLQKETLIQPGTQLATYKQDSKLLLSLPQNVILLVDGNSSVKLELHQNSFLKINLKWGCMGLKPYGSNLGKTFLQNEKQEVISLDVNKKLIFCFDSESGSIQPKEDEQSKDFFIDTGIFNAGSQEFNAIYPCDRIIELQDTENKKNVTMEFFAPALTKKRIEVSNSDSFEQLIYYSDGFSNKFTTSSLTEGTYYWRVMDAKEVSKPSSTCMFEIKKQKILKLILPQNDDVIVDTPISFSWSENFSGVKLLISKDIKMSNVIQEIDISGSTYTYENPYETLGTGRFYWQLVSDNESSSIRNFSIYDQDDLKLLTPLSGSNVQPDKDIILFKWSLLPMVRTYSVTISDTPNFVNNILTYSGKNSFLFSSSLPIADYYVKISALFNNNRKLLSKNSTFSVSEIKNIIVDEFNDNKTFLLSAAQGKKMLLPVKWQEVKDVNTFAVNLNSKKVALLKNKKNSTYIKVTKGLNNLEIIGYCNDDQQKECAKSKIISFNVEIDDSPALISPANKSTVSLNNKERIVIKWQQSNDEVEYQYSSDEAFLKILGSGKTKGGVAFIKPELGKCYLRLKKHGSNWGTVYSFNVLPQAPGIPVIVAPYNRKIFKEGKAYFQWNPTRGATAYEVQISRDKRFKYKRKYTTDKNNLSVSLKKGNYYWRILSFDIIENKKRYSSASKPRLIIIK